MRRIRITVSYDGTGFHGWQVQPGLTTIQSELQRVVSEIEGGRVDVAGSGRTDAGVHALAQVAAFSIENPIPVDNLRHAMNRLLPHSIRVTSVQETELEFHPRFGAKAKTYQYRIWRAEVCPPMQRLYVCHHPYPLDEARMAEFAALFEGEHDFSAFAASDSKTARGATKVRRIFASSVWRENDELIYQVRGSGFLKHMVRMIVGTLIEVGKGNLDRDAVLERLRPGFAGRTGPAARACGLRLVSVEYER